MRASASGVATAMDRARSLLCGPLRSALPRTVDPIALVSLYDCARPTGWLHTTLPAASAVPSRVKAHRYADANDIRGMTKAINGGYNGLDERTHYYLVAKKVLST